MIEGHRELLLADCSLSARGAAGASKAALRSKGDDDSLGKPIATGYDAVPSDADAAAAAEAARAAQVVTPAEEFDLETPAGVYELNLERPYERYVAIELLDLASFRAGCAFT